MELFCTHDRDASRPLFLLKFLCFLPVYNLNPKHLAMAIRRHIKDMSFENLANFLLPVVRAQKKGKEVVSSLST